MEIEELYILRCNTRHNIDQHLPLLRFLASKCDHITEFGTDEGYSTTAFLAAKPRTLHTYDIAEHPNFLDVLHARPHCTALYIHTQNTLDVEIVETDLLFIDTEHTYNQVAGELSLHGNKARKFIVLHDIVTYPEIVPAIREFFDCNPHWIVREWSTVQSGMAVLERVIYADAAAVYEGVVP